MRIWPKLTKISPFFLSFPQNAADKVLTIPPIHKIIRTMKKILQRQAVSTPFSFGIISGFLLLLVSCSGTPNIDPNLFPEVAQTGDQETIVILGTNDIHGALLPQTLKSREETPGTEVMYESGGLSTLVHYVKILRKTLGTHLLWLDAGDEWQGSLESNLAQGAPMVVGFNAGTLNAAAIGNHEFDYGARNSSENNPQAKDESPDLLGAMKDRLRDAQYPYLSANIFEKTSGKQPSWPNFYPSRLLKVGRLNVGVIGLTTLETPKTTLSDNIRTLEFRALRDATLRETQKLREQGAQVILAVAHVGLKCELGRMPLGHAIRKANDPQGPCRNADEMVQLIESLPEGTLDGVVSGHSHQVVHHYINGVPVIQGGVFAKYFNLIYLTYNFKEKRVVSDRTRIEGPIPVCPKVFRHQVDCNGDRSPPKEGRGKLVRARFRGELIEPDAEILKLTESYIQKAAEKKSEVISQVERPLDANRFAESPLGNLVADAIREAVQADISIMNAGGIRANIESGKMLYGDVFRTLPFENAISILSLTGKELKLLLEITQSGARGFYPTSGLKITAEMLTLDPEAQRNPPQVKARDLDQNGVQEAWESDRIHSLQLSDGSPLQDSKTYKIATVDFLVKGGDDFGWFMKQISSTKVTLESGITIRDAFINHVKKLSAKGPLNSIQAPLVDPQNPRLVLEAPHGKKSKGKSSRKKGRKKKGA